MKSIIRPDERVMKTLGRQTRQSAEWRLSKYSVTQELPDGNTLIYNTLTCEMLLIDSDDRNAEEELKKRWMLVPADADDKLTASQVRGIIEMISRMSKAASKYTILTTMDCNARCFYCYEKGRKRVIMNERTARRAADYIIEHCFESAATIMWYGGEPLYNSDVIDLICDRLSDSNIDFSSKMVSNGYLFDDELIEKAVNKWKLKKIQVTLDGTEEVYNRCKNYIYPDGSPYQRVLGNIEKLLAAGIAVSIRLNVDVHNADDLLILIDELSERLKGKGKLNIYAYPLFENAGFVPHERSAERRRLVYDKLYQIEDKLIELKLLSRGIDKGIKANHCMADSGNSVVILPGGELGLCEHHSDDEFIGNIFSEEIDKEVVESWKERREEIPECADCVCYPECIRLKKCAEDFECFPETREWKIRKIKQGMLNEYRKYLENKENNNETADENWEDC